MLVVAALAAAEHDIMKGGRSQDEDGTLLERPKSLLQDRQISSACNESSLILRDGGDDSGSYNVTSSAALSHSAQSLISGPSSIAQSAGLTKELYRVPGPPEGAAAPPSGYEPIVPSSSSSYNLYPGFEIAPGRPCTGATTSSYFTPYPRHSDYLEDTCASPYRPSSLMDTPSSPFSHDPNRHHHYRPFPPPPLHPKDPHHHPDHRLIHSYGQETYPSHHGYHSPSSASYPPQSISPSRLHPNHYHTHSGGATGGRLPPPPPPPANPYHPYGYF
jgi:hypothetical protein